MLATQYKFLEEYTPRAHALLRQHVDNVLPGVDYLSLAVSTKAGETYVIATHVLTEQEQRQVIATDHYCEQVCVEPAHYVWLQMQASQAHQGTAHYFWRQVGAQHVLFTLKSSQQHALFVQQLTQQVERWFELLDFWYMTWHDELEAAMGQVLPTIPCIFFDGLQWHMRLDDALTPKKTTRPHLILVK